MKVWRDRWDRAVWFLLSIPIYLKVFGIGVMVSLIFAMATLYQMQHSLAEYFYSDLASRARMIAESHAQIVTRPLITNDVLTIYSILNEAQGATPDIIYALVTDEEHRIVAHTFAGELPAFLRAVRPQPPDPAHSLILLRDGETMILDVEVPIIDGKAGWFRLGIADARFQKTRDRIVAAFAGILIACLVLGQLLAFVLTTILVWPINHLAAMSVRLRQGDLAARAKVYSADEVGHLTVTFNQMAETLMNNQIELRQQEQERRSLLQRLVTAQEEERKTIARELHDNFGQALATILMMFKRIKQADGRIAAVSDEFVHDLEEQLRLTIDGMRQLAHTLRPSILDDYGLDSALERYVLFLNKHADVRVEYQYVDNLRRGRLPAGVETAFFRIVQEAMSNILRHARAQTASILITRRENEVALLIEDDGVGFAVAEIPRRQPTSMGLIGMRERAALLDGRLMIESEPGQGTVIRVTVPLRRKNDDD